MRLRWFNKLSPSIQLLVLSGLIILGLCFYIPLSKYIKPFISSLLSPPLEFSQGVSLNARQLLQFQNLLEENKKLRKKVNELTTQLIQSQEALLENQRLRKLLSLPQRSAFKSCTALIIGKDTSNLTRTILINRGTKSGIKKGMPVVLGGGLVGKVIEAHPFVSKVSLIVDYNSKVPAKILRTREEGVVFGDSLGGNNVCKMKYIQKVKIGDKVISSGLGQIYPKGLLIGEVIAVVEEKNKLYKVAEIRPEIDFSTLEEVMVITEE